MTVFIGILKAIFTSRLGLGAVALTLAVVLVVTVLHRYGDDRELRGYERGAAYSTAVWSERYGRLEHAKVQVESLLTVAQKPVPPFSGAGRDRPKPDARIAARLDSAYRAGEARGRDYQQSQFVDSMYPWSLKRDTTQIVDGIPVRTQFDVWFDPLTRDYTYEIVPNPIFDRELLIRLGYIVGPPPPVEIRRDWAVELTLGSQVKDPALRVSPSIWYKYFGIGADFEPQRSPLFKGGVRWQF